MHSSCRSKINASKMKEKQKTNETVFRYVVGDTMKKLIFFRLFVGKQKTKASGVAIQT